MKANTFTAWSRRPFTFAKPGTVIKLIDLLLRIPSATEAEIVGISVPYLEVCNPV